MDFITSRKKFFIVSIAIILIGLLAMPFHAFQGNDILNFDIEFKGGSVIHIDLGQEVDIHADVAPIVRETLEDDSPRIQQVIGTTQLIITTKDTTTTQRKALFKALKEAYNLEDDALLQEENLSPTISNEIKSSAIKAVVIVAVLILIYVSIRFKDIKFGTSAVIALVHDVLIMFAVYSVFRVPINNSFIAAMLTIIGYSINDTIIVFDRIRENRGRMKGKDIEIINKSISQTITRSINTSITTLIMIGTLLVFGLGYRISSVTEFAFPLVVGVLSGTYSSIFIASPVWYELRKYSKKKVAAAAK
jgi:preprotein translocase SecF subunit